MLVAGTKLKLGALRICDIGCILIQQLFSKKYAGTRLDAMLSMEKTRRTTTPGNATKDLPYKVYVDSEYLYISWAPFAWWERYTLDSLDPLMKRTLSKLPPDVLRPKPHSSWIKKNNPTIRHGMCPWEHADLLSMKSTVTLAEQSRHVASSPSLDVADRSATTLVKLPTDELSASLPQLVQPTCEDVLNLFQDRTKQRLKSGSVFVEDCGIGWRGRGLRHRSAKPRIVGGAIATDGSVVRKTLKAALILQHQSADLFLPPVNILISKCPRQWMPKPSLLLLQEAPPGYTILQPPSLLSPFNRSHDHNRLKWSTPTKSLILYLIPGSKQKPCPRRG
ncbi:hypothetical protein Q7P37_009990 [Cladosporium fusiforme]